jgi:hypothetical protein
MASCQLLPSGIDCAVMETAHYVSKLLRHPHFNTRAKRMGKVIKVSPKNITFWEIGRQRQSIATW